MSEIALNKLGMLMILAVFMLGSAVGCRPFDHYDDPIGKPVDKHIEPPREMSMVSLPAYRLAPPDVVMLEIQKMIPKPPYHLECMDVVFLKVLGTPYDLPIENYYGISAEGNIDLGPGYGALRIEGMTIEQARDAITKHLSYILTSPDVSIQLAQIAAMQPISGQYPIGPDGCINLRQFGQIHVAGMTLMEAKLAIENHLAQFLNSPVISLDTVAYNSKYYYVITQGAANGDSVRKFPITGNETVLDAIANIGGFSQVSSQKMWIARPASGSYACEQRYPVDWMAISSGASTATNYQVMPGDRVYISQDNFITTSNWISRVFSPVERIMGVATFGASTIRNLKNTDTPYYGGGY